MSEYPKLI